MQNHLQKLPPMSALRPFEAAARHENFSVAADEISVTQAAVSKQIRQLEKYLGVPLFLRSGKNIELTAAGRDLHHAIANGLIQIARSCEQLQRGKRSDQVAITMRSPFASQFLAPRLKKLFAEFPALNFRLYTTDGDPALLLDTVDFAIVLGHEPQPEIVADHLVTEELLPVCSPGYLDVCGKITTASHLLNCDLLHLNAEHWRDLTWEMAEWPVFLNHLGIAANEDLGGHSFNNFEMLVRATVQGLGIGIGWVHLVEEELSAGSLVAPLDASYSIGRQHYLLCRRSQAQRRIFKELRSWFRDETAPFRTRRGIAAA